MWRQSPGRARVERAAAVLDNQELREPARPGEPSIRLEAKGMFGGQIEQAQPSFCCGIVRLGTSSIHQVGESRWAALRLPIRR
jgi:hypothetical protein